MIKPPSAGVGTRPSPMPVRPRPIDVLSGGVPGMTGSVGIKPVIKAMHDGGKVKQDGAYELEAGETVVPAKEKKKKSKAEEPEGRNSEYRKVYLSRKGKK